MDSKKAKFRICLKNFFKSLLLLLLLFLIFAGGLLLLAFVLTLLKINI